MRKSELKKILVIGSGPIVIGQAAEFDYAGTQACLALKEEGFEVVLINSNPATIMTDTNIADQVYIEPITLETVRKVIQKEKPDGLVATLGGQTALNMAVQLAENGILEEEGVELLGTNLEAIQTAEDRDRFRELMKKIKEPIPESAIVDSVRQALHFVERIGFPVIVRPAYTLGGTGGGIANDIGELEAIVNSGLKNSPIGQCLVEKSIAGYKEIEYEVMRDANDNCIIVCNMENVDPVGIHTGDSIVVAPSQTLSDRDYQMLRSVSLKIVRALNIEGGCNVQLALDPHSSKYYVIEVNPRVSRSSALASKATGYPIAKLAAKIAVGYTLDELKNPVTGQTYACFEPALDYVVSKIPRWPFDKFVEADRSLGTQMKATGEVMAIGRTFEESMMKAVRSLEIGACHLELPGVNGMKPEVLKERIRKADDERLFLIAEAFRREISLETVHEWTGIDYFFLEKLKAMVDLEPIIRENPLTRELLEEAKNMGFTDKKIAELCSCSEQDIYQKRKEWGLLPVYKMVDTCAAEFEATTPYYYSTYEEEDEVEETGRPKVLVLGSGPIRIGQGIEFDYATVHAAWAIKEAGYESVIINNNPETVSTDFSTSDRLYFEPLYLEDVLHVIEREKPAGVIVQFGGQTAINLAQGLSRAGVNILGTSLEDIDTAEDREKFDRLIKALKIPQPEGKTVTSVQEALKAAKSLGYPVLVRPSYVLGGRAMEIVYEEKELKNYMNEAVKVNPQHPVLIDRYLPGLELEVDAISDGKNVLIPGIMEHIERAGVHSGDSAAVYPAQSISREIKESVISLTRKIALNIRTIGLINIQYVVHQNRVYVLEVNPRASRTVPFLSKVTGVPMAKVATRAILGQSLSEQGYSDGYFPEDDHVSVKFPVFSFAKLRGVDPALGPEMKSTGEVMGREKGFAQAMYKALLAAGFTIVTQGSLLVSAADKDKAEAVEIVKNYSLKGFKILATPGTASVLQKAGIPVRSGTQSELQELIRKGECDLMINTKTKGKSDRRFGFQMRRTAAENGIPCLTSLDTAKSYLEALAAVSHAVEPILLPELDGEPSRT